LASWDAFDDVAKMELRILAVPERVCIDLVSTAYKEVGELPIGIVIGL
jgi:hypothetical protein